MNSRILVAFLVAGSMSGCVIYGGGGGSGGGGGGGGPAPGYPGDVTFEWSFAGAACSAVPDVDSVRISIPGETLQSGGVFPCLLAGYPGVVLHDFAPGTYSFTIDAVDSSGNVLFLDSGTFTVNGNTPVLVDLQPAPGANSYAYIAWTFPSVSSCSQAGVTSVRVSIDYGNWQEHPCTDGFYTGGVVTDWLDSGQHAIELEGLDASGYPLYRYAGTLTTSVGNPVFVEYTLSLSVGGVSVEWQLPSFKVCASGTDTAYVNFWDVQNQSWVYPHTVDQPGDPRFCSDGYSPVLYNYLQAGTYDVWVTALDSSLIWRMPVEPLQTVTVVAGQFVTSSSPSVFVQLF